MRVSKRKPRFNTYDPCPKLQFGMSLSLPLTLALLLLVLTTGCAWPMYRGGPGRTGQSPVDTTSNKGALQWSSLAGDFSSIGYVPNGPVIGAGPVIYVGSRDGKLFAFNSDGSVRWIYDTGIGGYLTAAAIGDLDTIYATNGNLYAITAAGALQWEFVPPGPGIPFEPAVGSDGTIYFGDQCGNFYALTTGGSVKWKFTQYGIDCTSASAPVSAPVLASDGTIYASVAGTTNVLFALTPGGALKWAMAGFSGLPRAVSSAGALYAADGYHLTSINPSGTINWQISLQSFYSSPAIGNDGTIYMASNESGLLALNPADGSLKWQFATGGLSSPSIGADGTIYVPDTAALYAVNPDGTFKWLQDWSSTTQCGVFHNEPAIGPDGTIYIIPDNDGQPCTIVDPSPPLLAIH